MRLESRLLNKQLGTASLDADDSQFCSAAVPGEDWGKNGKLRFALLRASRDAVRQEATIRLLDLAPIIANGLATYLQFIKQLLFVFLSQVSSFNPSLKLSCNLSDFMFFPKLSSI